MKVENPSKRLNTKLESEGAEFLVLGKLLIHGIASYKAYTNMPGYDLVATNPEENLSVRIQVKSRYNTNWDGFIINNFDSDFVVFVALNRGHSRKRGDESYTLEPNFYVFPIEYVKKISDPNNSWGKIRKNFMVDFEKYETQQSLIKEKLKIKTVPNNV